jgi:NADH-quinone oxidoreductase subunit M
VVRLDRAALGLAGMVYGALLAVLQIDLAPLAGLRSISQTGVLMAGLFSLKAAGLKGALLLSLNLGLAAAGLFVVGGVIEPPAEHHALSTFGRLVRRAAVAGLMFLVVVLGSIAMPGTPGFEAAHLALEGTLEAFGWGVATVAAFRQCAGRRLSAVGLSADFPGPQSQSRRRAPLYDLRNRELIMAGLLCAVMIGVGLYADPWIRMIGESVENVARVFEVGGGH